MTVPAPDRGQAGFTLIELMISLGLFALIAVAGLGMVDGILGVQGRTEQRLDRLTDLQRAMYVIGGDLEQVAHGPITGDASGMRFTRAAPGLGGAPVAMAFRLNGDRMTRDSGGGSQLLLSGVASVRWRYLGDGWAASWPADPQRPDEWPRAVEVEMQLTPGGGPAGTLRKLVVLPVHSAGRPVMRVVDADEQGMILVNVLMFVAIATGLVLLMINREELALDRALRIREASRALAIVRGGEVSAVAALARDQATAPGADHSREPWAAIGESGVPIDGGTFDLAIADAEGRFNLNNLRGNIDQADTSAFLTIARASGLSDEQAIGAIALMREKGPITDIRPLRFAGLDPEAVTRIERLVTALPGHTTINVNSAPPELLTSLLNDSAAVERLVAIRAAKGFVTNDDLGTVGLTLPQTMSFQSHTYWVRTRATIGETVQQGVSLIQRFETADGKQRTVPVERWRNASLPPGIPAFAPPRGAT